MKVVIYSTFIDGAIISPSSKSFAQRAIAVASLADGCSIIRNVTWCGDVMSALNAAGALGASYGIENGNLLIYGKAEPVSGTIDCGESGLSIRMFAPIAALNNEQFIITGTGTLLKRPVHILEEPLKLLGVEITTNNGYPPVKIKGPLKNKNITVDGSVSSQVLTGLLIAMPLVQGNSEIKTKSLASKNYIDITLSVMKTFGVSVDNNGYDSFLIEGGQKYKPAEIEIEGDWSSAAFILTAAALSGKVKIKKLSVNSLQPDKIIFNILQQSGATVKAVDNNVTCKQKQLKAFTFDACNCPDLFPPLTALACRCNGRSRIHGVQRLVYKESNRLEVLIREFSKTGSRLFCEDNTLVIEPGELQPAEIFPENDHRIAMAAAVLYCGSDKIVVINQAECVNKSYPGFWEDLKCLGSIIGIG